jgi:hypothetical protein
MVRGRSLALACALLGGSTAAADPVKTIGVAAGYARHTEGEVAEDAPADAVAPIAHGAGLTLDGTYELNAAIALRVAVGGAALWVDDAQVRQGTIVLGARYALDVIRYVPYLDVGLAGIVVDGDDADAITHLSIEAGVGLDVLLGRTWSWGPYAKMTGFVDESLGAAAGLRVAYHWGFF